MAVDASSAFALDVNSVAKLKYAARGDSGKGLKAAARQFEAMFIQKMLHSMRAAVPKSGLTDNQQEQDYNHMLDAQYAQTLAKRGIGVADLLIRQMQAKGLVKPGSQMDRPADPLAGIARANPKPLGASEPIAANRRQAPGSAPAPKNPARPLFASQAPAKPLFALAPANPAATTDTQDAAAEPPDYVTRFIQRMGGAADRAARETGLPRRLILAQAALESGWGRHQVTAADGKPSFNVFNIKAAGWHGPRAPADTTEFDNGEAHATRADFRVYHSYAQAFGDYARLLSQTPRYAPVMQAGTAEDAARALQDCGYATDPAYADKLVSIMARIPANANQAPAPLVDHNSVAQPLIDLAAQANAIPAGSSGDASRAGSIHRPFQGVSKNV